MVASLDSAFGSSLTVSAASAPSMGSGNDGGGGYGIGRRSGTTSTTNKGMQQLSPPQPAQLSVADAPGAIGAPSSGAGGGGTNGGGGGMSSYLYPITTEEKLQTLTHELTRQKEYLESQRLGYFDKLMSRRRDVMKLIMFCLIILLALSIHTNIKHYYRVFFDTNVVTGQKEVLLRLMYPAAILFALWNSRLLTLHQPNFGTPRGG